MPEVNMYDVHEQERREAATLAYIMSPDFKEIAAEAANRGYRKATIQEINASARSAPWAIELFCWRGGLWVKLN